MLVNPMGRERSAVQENKAPVKANALWYVAPHRAELRQEPVPLPKPGEVQIRASFGAISRGTERLVAAGRVPESEYQRMRAPRMGGAFPFPVKYGYATVGIVELGPAELRGKSTFALHPHQELFNLPVEEVFLLPDGVSPQRAVLAANMETALNALWDGLPAACDRIAVVGGGLVGLLTAYLCARLPGAEVTVLDVVPSRRELARSIGCRFTSSPADVLDCDVVFHASGTAAGLATALRIAGDEATIVELSWYGSGEVSVALGEGFHSRRLRLIASQVGKVAPSHRTRWSSTRRLAAALALLRDPALDALIASPVEFTRLPGELEGIFSAQSDAVCQLIRYR
jgi:NADPH:quinone reductase-like Zn-dependent oxidoreductase